MRIRIKNRFIEISRWPIKSFCYGSFGGLGGFGKYWSYKTIKVSLGHEKSNWK